MSCDVSEPVLARTVRGYGAPNTEVLFLIGGCTVPVNAAVWFSGRLVDFPVP